MCPETLCPRVCLSHSVLARRSPLLSFREFYHIYCHLGSEVIRTHCMPMVEVVRRGGPACVSHVDDITLVARNWPWWEFTPRKPADAARQASPLQKRLASTCQPSALCPRVRQATEGQAGGGRDKCLWSQENTSAF